MARWLVLLVVSLWGAQTAGLKPGERVEVGGQAWVVERVDDGRVVLTLPQPPTATLGAFITPVEATATDSQTAAGRVPRRLIDGSGWSELYPGSGVYTHANDVYAGGACMWNGAPNASLTFDLGASRWLAGMYVWNYNEAGGWATRGVKALAVSASLDGQAWEPVGTFELRVASGQPDDRGQAVPFGKPVQARWVRFDIKSNYRGGEMSGLAEVRFADADRAADPPQGVDWSPRYPRPALRRVPLGQPLAGAENIVYPADAVVDVTKPPYSAKGDGVTDDTAAIQKALDDHPNAGAIIYLPNGVYRVSDTLRWGGDRGSQKRTVLHGQSRDGTVIALRDNCPGFGSPARPKAVIYTGQAPAQRFGNEIHHLTVDTGVDNIGACGIQFIANNQGGVYDVAVVSGDGWGLAGLDLGYTDEQGPCLIQRVKVTGFDIGVHLARGVASVTLESIEVERQNRFGLRNDGQPMTLRGLRSRNSVTGLALGAGFSVVLDSELTGTGTASGLPAVVCDSPAMLRAIVSSGYKQVLESHVAGVPSVAGARVDQWLSKPAVALVGQGVGGLRLPVRETPTVPHDDPATWVSVARYGGLPNDDKPDADALQQAIDSGATTVYLPRGRYRLDKTVIVRGGVRRLVGAKAWIEVASPLRDQAAPCLRMGDGAEPTVLLEWLDTDFSSGPYWFLDNPSTRTLVLARCGINFQGAAAYKGSGAGSVFIEDVVGRWFSIKGQQVWARQFNPEGNGTHISNDGGRLWILGLKTEGGGTLVETKGGGDSEVLGGFSYTTEQGKLAPMFTVDAGRLAVSFAEICFSGDPFATIVRARSGEAVVDLGREDPRWGGHLSLLEVNK